MSGLFKRKMRIKRILYIIILMVFIFSSCSVLPPELGQPLQAEWDQQMEIIRQKIISQISAYLEKKVDDAKNSIAETFNDFIDQISEDFRSFFPDMDTPREEFPRSSTHEISGFGIGSSTHLRAPDSLGFAYSDINTMRIEFIREEFPMSEIQLLNDYYVFNYEYENLTRNFDRMVSLAEQYGLEIVALLSYGPSVNYQDNEYFFELWEKYVSKIVDKYGDKINYWEIGNEMNSQDMWKKVRINATHVEVDVYARMLKSAHQIIKQDNSRDVVIVGGLINDTDFTNGYSPIEFLQELRKYTDGTTFDAVALHPYWANSMPETVRHQKTFDEYEYFTMVDYVNNFSSNVNRIYDNDIPIWITEVGYEETSLESESQKYGISVGDFQTIALARTYISLFALPNVASIFWYTYVNDTTGQQMAINEESKSVLRVISEALTGSIPIESERIINSDGNPIENTFEYRFKRSDGKTILIFWKNQPEDVSYSAVVQNLTGSPAYLYNLQEDVNGTGTRIDDNTTLFLITETPQILIGNMDGNTELVVRDNNN